MPYSHLSHKMLKFETHIALICYMLKMVDFDSFGGFSNSLRMANIPQILKFDSHIANIEQKCWGRFPTGHFDETLSLTISGTASTMNFGSDIILIHKSTEMVRTETKKRHYKSLYVF